MARIGFVRCAASDQQPAATRTPPTRHEIFVWNSAHGLIIWCKISFPQHASHTVKLWPLSLCLLQAIKAPTFAS